MPEIEDMDYLRRKEYLRRQGETILQLADRLRTEIDILVKEVRETMEDDGGQ